MLSTQRERAARKDEAEENQKRQRYQSRKSRTVTEYRRDSRGQSFAEIFTFFTRVKKARS